jgi:hypothetical protein
MKEMEIKKGEKKQIQKKYKNGPGETKKPSLENGVRPSSFLCRTGTQLFLAAR